MIDLERITAKHIIFDLDGTLIDSATAILASMERAFSVCGQIPATPLTSSLIGPPLMKILEELIGTHDLATLNPIAEAFKTHYDEIGYRQTTVFSGVPEMLDELHKRNRSLYLATNKRIIPTRKIIKLFGWKKNFKAAYGLDTYFPALKTKSELLRRIAQEHYLDPNETIYVGDRQEDGDAAAVNGMAFLKVEWGYSE